MKISAKAVNDSFKRLNEDINKSDTTIVWDGTYNVGKAWGYVEDVKDVIIQDGVEKIRSGAFCNCINLKSVTIPNSVKYIEHAAFDSCRSLESIIIPNSVKEISTDAFGDCVLLKNIQLSNSLTRIDTQAFMGCESLQSITIPASVKYISYDVFQWCDNLKTVYLENPNTEYEDNSFPKHTKIIKKGIDESITQANISEYPIEFDYRYETDDIMDFFKGFITVKAHNEKEAINKAKKYLNSSEYLNKHINHYDPTNIKISDTFYKNVDVVEGTSNVNENRRIELAKKLLEGEGYRIRRKSLNEVASESDFIDPMKVVISIKPEEDDDYHMQQAINFFNKNIHTWKLGPEILTDNDDGTYQLCFPGIDDWINKIKLHCEESILDIQVEPLI